MFDQGSVIRVRMLEWKKLTLAFQIFRTSNENLLINFEYERQPHPKKPPQPLLQIPIHISNKCPSTPPPTLTPNPPLPPLPMHPPSPPPHPNQHQLTIPKNFQLQVTYATSVKYQDTGCETAPILSPVPWAKTLNTTIPNIKNVYAID